jgi:glycosyltransferase involved in cell wall biosynthesis
LAQTYSPLQVVISDDCSQDRTFEVIQEEVDGYDGPHQILLNRNSQNLGLSGHVNHTIELAKGELIVVAAADDVSLPTRTEELARAWSEGGVYCVCSDVTIIDEDGVDRGLFVGGKPVPVQSWQEAIQNENTSVLGCTFAWDRAIFSTFGPLPDGICHEDKAIQLRAALLGRIAYVDRRLVKWRRHGANDSKDVNEQLQMDLKQFTEFHTAHAQERSVVYASWLHDMRLFSCIRPETKAKLLQAMEIVVARAELNNFKASVQDYNLMDRVRSGMCTAKRIKQLGAKPVIQVCLLSASPVAYSWAQKYYYKAQYLRARRRR